MIWNPFKKVKSDISSGAMKMMRAAAMKKLEKMDPKERENLMRQAFDPKNKDKLLSAMEMMRKSGQISEEQYKEAKKKIFLNEEEGNV